jgi:hypothetical protein
LRLCVFHLGLKGALRRFRAVQYPLERLQSHRVLRRPVRDLGAQFLFYIASGSKLALEVLDGRIRPRQLRLLRGDALLFNVPS